MKPGIVCKEKEVAHLLAHTVYKPSKDLLWHPWHSATIGNRVLVWVCNQVSTHGTTMRSQIFASLFGDPRESSAAIHTTGRLSESSHPPTRDRWIETDVMKA